MIFEYQTLKFIWFAIIGCLFIGFSITGGYDFGVGILLPFIGKNDEERRIILRSILPNWEGNQVWLITAAASLFATWPFLYATLFSALYFVLLMILFMLILRPPGLDYRSKMHSPTWRQFWDIAFFVSNLIPPILFGLALGNIFLGIPFHFDNMLRSHFMGSFFSWFNPYALLMSVVVLSLFLFQGALFLQIKTTGIVNERSKIAALLFGNLFLITFLVMGFVTLKYSFGFQIQSMGDINQSLIPTLKTVKQDQGLWMHNYQTFKWGWLFPLLVIITTIISMLFSKWAKPLSAFFFSSICIVFVFITLGFTLFPFILPSSSIPNHSLTIWDAVSSKLTLSWMFWAVVLLLPIVLLYTSWAFKVVKGKVDSETLQAE